MGTLIAFSCFLVAWQLQISLSRGATLRFVFSYFRNGQTHDDVINEIVPQSFVDAWTGDAVGKPVVLSRFSPENCTYSKTFTSSQLRSGLFVNHPALNTCSNQDLDNSTLLFSYSRLTPDSHSVSSESTNTIVKLVECCQAVCLAVAVIQESHIATGQSPFGNLNNNTLTFLSKNSIFFVAISFIVLMIISLGWLAFYYVERFRNAHTKEYISKRIAKAAKKALSKMPLKTVHGIGADDVNYQSEQCTICIEHFRQNDTVRILPCKHLYHKVCIDPWLMENHTCPVCKLDILTASGIELPYGRYNCDFDSVVVGRSLELYPVQLDLLMHAGESASPGSSDSIMGDQEIQLVHIRPPAVQIHSIHPQFRPYSSRRSSAASSSSHCGKVDEEGPSAASSSEDLSKLLGGKDETSLTAESKSNNRQTGEDKKRPRRLRNRSNCSKNVACVVDVIAPATPPLDLAPVATTIAESTSSIAEE